VSSRARGARALAEHLTDHVAEASTDEYRYSPPAEPGHCPTHPGCAIVRCRRFFCNKPVHILNRPGRPRRFCSTACRVAEHRRLR
jgi:hypothetical protein